ncbi:unnamed protein product [Paramecium primaurelia]|uniref:Uncharacterized protein n=1 Tax=Paramecium primaurelia TaxID=5886 RepID=A0A8S1M283_PARPR|nr:unnamed protein product [Paramecium primaurelia]
MKGGTAQQQILVIDKIQILLNKIFAYRNLAERRIRSLSKHFYKVLFYKQWV